MQYGTGILDRKIRDLNIKIDGRNATLSADVPKTETHEDYGKTEEVVYTNPVDLLKQGVLPSFSLVRFGKVKNFVDGVYAVVEERISEQGHKLSREQFLEGLEKVVSENAQKYISIIRTKRTSDEPEITIPQGFYDWSPQLREVYKQIKILAREPGFLVGSEDNERLNGKIMRDINQGIEGSDALLNSYNAILEVYSRMTGKPENKVALFPSAELPDQKFFKKLSFELQSDLPQGLGKLLIKAVRQGEVNFVPKADSGLYVRQMFEIIPLVLRDSPEFKKFLVNDKYQEILENEFISQWAGTRHTHVGHTNFGEMLIGSSMPYNEPISIYPELKLEPFATSYERMRESLAFLEETIREYLPEVLDRRRLMNDGSRTEISIGKEFEEMKPLLRGLELISKDSIHLPYKDERAQEAQKKALTWIKDAQNDKDLNRNMAIFVPIIRTTDGSRQISYINAGFKTIDVDVSYHDKPKIEIDGSEERFGLRHKFTSKRHHFPVLVHREVRVPYRKLINDRKLRDMLKGSFTELELDDIVQKLETA